MQSVCSGCGSDVMLCGRVSLLMNVTRLAFDTMMSFGLTVLLVIVMVVVATAPAGVVVGLVGEVDDELDELELGEVDELPQASIATAAAMVATSTHIRGFRVICIAPLDLNSRPE